MYLRMLLSLLFLVAHTRAQDFYVVDDKDGYVNVRRDAAASSPVMDKLLNGEVVFNMETEGAWMNVDYHIVGKTDFFSGYVHASRLKDIRKFTAVPLMKKGDSSYVFGKDSVQVNISWGRFNATANRIKYSGNFIEKINGRHPWGRDGVMPTAQYKSLQLHWKGNTMVVPDSMMHDLFQPDPGNIRVWVQGVRLYVASSNSDGAGSYSVCWVFEQGKFHRRYIYTGF